MNDELDALKNDYFRRKPLEIDLSYSEAPQYC